MRGIEGFKFGFIGLFRVPPAKKLEGLGQPPSLESETRVVERSMPLLRPYISASVGREMMGIGGGVSIKDRVDVGAKYMRIGSTNAVMFEASYRFKVKDR